MYFSQLSEKLIDDNNFFSSRYNTYFHLYYNLQEYNTLNKKYLKYILPLFLVFILIAIFIPSLITQGTKRVINYSEEYKELAPFQFVVNTDKLKIEEGEDAEINLLLKGVVLPETVYLVCENGTFLMKKIARNSYQSWIKKPKNNKIFFFKANDFVSKNFLLNVTGKSVLGKLQATMVTNNKNKKPLKLFFILQSFII